MSDHQALYAAVAARLRVLIPTLTRRGDGYLYGAGRTQPDALGARFRQLLGGPEGLAAPVRTTPEAVLAGEHDDALEAAWHGGAAADHLYAVESDHSWSRPVGRASAAVS